jgi:tRNA pseudouridine55 synthase
MSIDGILNVHKPRGLTSHDVVEAVRSWSQQKRVGHAGTLDPLATGVLILCLGRATRLASYLEEGTKSYCAEVFLGVTTDTDDAQGRILSVASVEATLADLEGALATLQAQRQQVPPRYAAIKRQGVPYYRLARQGLDFEPTPREVRIHRIELVAWEPPTVVLTVECGKGTYVRSLARDLGQLLGCGAHLRSLVRLRSGRFLLEDAVDMENLQLGFAHGFWEEFLYPVDEAVLEYDAMILGQDNETRVKDGQSLSFSRGAGDRAERSSPCRAYSLQGQFLALMSWDQVRGHWLPARVFV